MECAGGSRVITNAVKPERTAAIALKNRVAPPSSRAVGASYETNLDISAINANKAKIYHASGFMLDAICLA